MKAESAGRQQIRKLAFFLILALPAILIPVSSNPARKIPSTQQRQPLTPNPRSPVHHLVVLHTNDTHGHPVKFYHYPDPDVGGLPARATLVRRIRKENKNVLLLDAGDFNTGRAESNFFKARPDLQGYNFIGYDALVLGNHEFDNPATVLQEQMKQAHFPFLSANIKTRNGGYLAQPYLIKEFAGFRVAVLGLTTREAKFICNPEHIKDLIFEDEVQVARKLVPELRKQTDIVIVLAHLGIHESFQRGSKRLASQVSGIDLIVDGHSHTRLDEPIVVKNFPSNHNTLIVQAWQWGLVLGRIDLWIRDRKVIDYRFEAIPVVAKKAGFKAAGKVPDATAASLVTNKGVEEDKELLSLLQPYVKQLGSLLSEIIGQAEGVFLNRTGIDEETALGDLVADSMLWYTKKLGADFAIQNGGGIRAALPAGRIVRGTIHEILPFDNSVVVVTLRGRDVHSLLSHMATEIGRGGFPQVSEGVNLIVNHPAGTMERALLNGKPIDSGKIYKVATNSYLAAGGDGYRVLRKAIDRYDTSVFQRDVLIEYIRHLGGRIRPRTGRRIRIIRGKVRQGKVQPPSKLTGKLKFPVSASEPRSGMLLPGAPPHTLRCPASRG
ncbi:MAG: 5'-nucleotidase C-terminal domain-containing protein [bacterium]